MPACDGQTDRQTDVKPIAITCFSIADARKNLISMQLNTISTLARDLHIVERLWPVTKSIVYAMSIKAYVVEWPFSDPYCRLSI